MVRRGMSGCLFLVLVVCLPATANIAKRLTQTIPMFRLNCHHDIVFLYYPLMLYVQPECNKGYVMLC